MNLDKLEPRESPALLLDIVLSGTWATDPRGQRIVNVLAEMAGRVTPLVPLVPLAGDYTAAWWSGTDPDPGPLSANALRVYVGDSVPPQYDGLGGPVGWSAQTALPRSPGGAIDLQPTLHGVALDNALRHEFGHVLGVGHAPVGPALMDPYTDIDRSNLGTMDDVRPFRAAGYRLEVPVPFVPDPSGGRSATGWTQPGPPPGPDFVLYTGFRHGGWAWVPA